MKKKLLPCLMLIGILQSHTMIAQAVAQDLTAEKLTTKMLEVLGGRDKWMNLKSLYIKAIHTEPTLTHPYQSEIWRGIDEFKMRIEQQSQDFHKIGLFSNLGGWVQNIQSDSVRKLSDQALMNSISSHDKNIYVLLKQIALGSEFSPKINGQRLEFFKEDKIMVTFVLDDQYRPEIFMTPNINGGEDVSHFDRWDESEGFIHPAGGGPLDGNFHYQTEAWKPSMYNFDQAFSVKYVFDD